MLIISDRYVVVRSARFAVSALSTAILLATLSISPAQADDLEIYQPSLTGGGSTLVLMMDGAGDMNTGNPSNLSQVVTGLQIFLATDDPKINPTSVGLGHYNNFNDLKGATNQGTGTSADIIVAAAPLGSVVNSTTKFGTYGQYVSGVQLYEPAITSPRSQRRRLWDYVVATKSSPTTDNYAFDGNSTANPMQGYAEAASYLLGTTTTGAPNSGFATSISRSKNGSIYQTPLTSDSTTCAGVGIYFLTGGAFSTTNQSDGEAIFSKALSTSSTTASFSCPAFDTYIQPNGNDLWNCMAGFAQNLYNGNSPAAAALNHVSIRTAFVGFGANFASLPSNKPGVLDVCHIGSKLKGDACSPDSLTNKNPATGYGNGGFYAVTGPTDVTASVKNFILTLGGDTVTPLVTGAATIPIDDLTQNGFQNYGYLRMIAPNPAQPAKLLWNGNVKKYALSGGALVSNGTTNTYVLNSLGQLNSTSTTGVSTTDNWDATAGNNVAAGTDDGGSITLGGAYPKVPMPTTTDSNTIRPLFTDLGSVTVVTPSTSGLTNTSSNTYTTTGITSDFTDVLASVSNGSTLTTVKPDAAGALVTTIPEMFDSANTSVNASSPLKNLSIVQKKKLINYLGFNLPIYGSDGSPLSQTRSPTVVFSAAQTITNPDNSTTVIPEVDYADPTPVPSDLTPYVQDSAYLSMGGSVHAQPIQLTYGADVVPVSTSYPDGFAHRDESVLYGSMEGALHMVNASNGVEQMAFVPAEILAQEIESKALKVDAENKTSTTVGDLNTPAQGVDGPWVADPVFVSAKTTSSSGTTTSIKASQMYVYGGLRMGGSSYYGLDLTNKSGDVVTPKLLFRISAPVNSSTCTSDSSKTADPTQHPYYDPMCGLGFDRMGLSFSKPILANVRYNNKIIRVMIVGGGYDTGYESASYVPTSSAPAQGNAVYMVNAKTGALVWEATASSQTIPSGASQTNNSLMIHSVASRVSAVDRDGDGLIDAIYFGDLGGQIFRADINNAYSTPTSLFGARVTRIANLATDSTGTALTNGTNPRFFEAPTVTINHYNSTAFALVTAASGNRSMPLDVLSTSVGGHGLRNLPVNNVYGIIDRDLGRTDLMKLNSNKTAYVDSTGSTFSPNTVDENLSNLQKDPETLTGVVGDTFFPKSSTSKDGWYRSLSSTYNGTELSNSSSFTYANGDQMYSGGLKAYEEQIALTGKLYVPVYDPQGTGVPGHLCQARVVGETDLQTYCLPFGVCLNSAGKVDSTVENSTSLTRSGARYKVSSGVITNDNVIGPGIRGISLGSNGTPSVGQCNDFTLVGNQGGTGNWSCTRKLIPTLWYEKQPNTNKVQ